MGSLCQSLDKFGNQELSHLIVITEIENLFHILHKYVVGNQYVCQDVARLSCDLLVDVSILVALCCFLPLLEQCILLSNLPNIGTYFFKIILPRWERAMVSSTLCIVTHLHVFNKTSSGTCLIYYNVSMIPCRYVGPHHQWTSIRIHNTWHWHVDEPPMLHGTHL